MRKMVTGARARPRRDGRGARGRVEKAEDSTQFAGSSRNVPKKCIVSFGGVLRCRGDGCFSTPPSLPTTVVNWLDVGFYCLER